MTLRVKSVLIEIDFWFAAVLTLMLLLFPQSSAGVCFLLCILHESGHLGAMLIFKSRPKKIQLGYFGMKIVTGTRLLSPLMEIIIAAFGPLANLTSAAVLFLLNYRSAALISTGLAAFNLLPVTMLDGGRILSAVIKDGRFLKITGFVTAVLLMILGIAAALYTKRNFTILAVSVYILIGLLTAS